MNSTQPLHVARHPPSGSWIVATALVCGFFATFVALSYPPLALAAVTGALSVFVVDRLTEFAR